MYLSVYSQLMRQSLAPKKWPKWASILSFLVVLTIRVLVPVFTTTETCWPSPKSGYIPEFHLPSSLAHHTHSPLSFSSNVSGSMSEHLSPVPIRAMLHGAEIPDVAVSVTRPVFYEAVVFVLPARMALCCHSWPALNRLAEMFDFERGFITFLSHTQRTI